MFEVCWCCSIPLCPECAVGLQRGGKIPKAFANDSFIFYQHRFIVENKVAWLEATIACPVFSGLVTYYIDGGRAPERPHDARSAGQTAESMGGAWKHLLFLATLGSSHVAAFEVLFDRRSP